MKKRVLALAAICMSAMMFGGCAGEISNDYVTISQYKGVEVEKVEIPEATAEEVDAEIQSKLEGNAEYKDITDRPAQLGDEVTIDYVGTKDGVAFDGGTANDYYLELGSGTFIEGFEDGIVGHSIGETFELNLTFPENYGSAELAGQEVVFTVTLDAITEIKVPELTDEWVQTVSEESKTVDEYKEEIKASLKAFYEENASSTIMSRAWDAVMENTTVNSYPTEELQTLIQQYNDTYKGMAEQNSMEFEEFLENYMNMDLDTFNSEVSTVAKQQMKETMAVDLIIEKEKLDASEEAIQTIYEEYAAYYGYESVDAMVEEMEAGGNGELLEDMARLQIVQKWLADNCKQVEATEGAEGSEE